MILAWGMATHGDLGRLQVERVGRRHGKRGEAPQSAESEMTKGVLSQSAMARDRAALASLLAATGVLAVALIIVALHAIKPNSSRPGASSASMRSAGMGGS
jgi:hypothetical protein